LAGHGHAHLGTTRSRPFGERLTRIAVSERHHEGVEIVTAPAGGAIPVDHDLLFVISGDGRLVPVTEHQRPGPEEATRWAARPSTPPGAAVLNR